MTTAGSVLRGQQPLPALLERIRESFGMRSVSLLECATGDCDDGSEPTRAAASAASRIRGTGKGWTAVATAGDAPVTGPDDADVEVPVTDTLSLALRGRPLPAADRRVLGAFAAYAAAALEQLRLAAEAEAAKPIAEADRMRTALLTAVSHDLRTPLASAKAAVTSLRSPEVRWTAADRDELLATADESLDRLARLVDNLLDMSRLQAGALSLFPRPVGVDEIVARSLDDLGPRSRSVLVDIPDSLPEVQVDPAILERVVVNVTENALRYSPPGKPPLLTASALGDRVELRVIDRGPGIPEKERDRVFVPFQRLGDTDNTTGVGLGLALSRGFIEAMGGTLTAEDTPGGGLTMAMSLPAVAAEPGLEHGAAEPGQRERDAGTGRRSSAGQPGGAVTRVLVVDDEPQILRALRINLRVRQYEVFTAASGAEALEVAGHHPPDLVILDLGLPDLSGIDVIQGLRGWTAVPIVVLSGRADSADKVEALDAGADDYVTKPFSMDELLARMRAAVRRSGTPEDQPRVRLGDLVVDLAAKRVERAAAAGTGRQPARARAGRRWATRAPPGGAIRLTPTEWHLLEVLLRHPGKLLSQQQLLTEVWGPGYASATGNLRLYMAQLRRKLEPDPARPRWLITEPGMGYRYQPGPESGPGPGSDLGG